MFLIFYSHVKLPSIIQFHAVIFWVGLFYYLVAIFFFFFGMFWKCVNLTACPGLDNSFDFQNHVCVYVFVCVCVCVCVWWCVYVCVIKGSDVSECFFWIQLLTSWLVEVSFLRGLSTIPPYPLFCSAYLLSSSLLQLHLSKNRPWPLLKSTSSFTLSLHSFHSNFQRILDRSVIFQVLSNYSRLSFVVDRDWSIFFSFSFFFLDFLSFTFHWILS